MNADFHCRHNLWPDYMCYTTVRFTLLYKTFTAVLPDKSSWNKILWGFSWDFVQFYIPLVTRYIQHVKLHKLHSKEISNSFFFFFLFTNLWLLHLNRNHSDAKTAYLTTGPSHASLCTPHELISAQGRWRNTKKLIFFVYFPEGVCFHVLWILRHPRNYLL